MTFSEKLAFLMKLTDVSNKQLATALAVDPSLISRMRTGSRGAPRSSDFAKKAGLYFSKRCGGESQLVALADALDENELRTGVSADGLAALLTGWLNDGEDGGSRLSHTYTRCKLTEMGDGARPPAARPLKSASAGYVFYGNAGKRAGVRTLMEHLSELERPVEVLITSDESQQWILEESAFRGELMQTLSRLRARGFTAKRITPQARSVDQALDTLMRWIDAEMEEQATTYFYPRLRDDVFRRTLLVAPGAAALVSTSVAGAEEGGAVMLTFDPRLVGALEREFRDYLAKCRRAATVYTGAGSRDRQVECAVRFESHMADTVQGSNSLSSITTPPEILLSDGESDALLVRYQAAQAQFERNLQQHTCIDLLRLAEPEHIAAGQTVVSAQYLLRGKKMFYSPETYRLHLARILDLTERYEGYMPMLWRPEVSGGVAIQVKQGLCAELVRTLPSFGIFEVVEPNIVAACQEYLLAMAETGAPLAEKRKQTVRQIRELLAQL